MKYVPILLLALLGACSSYGFRIHGEDMTLSGTTSPLAVEASGKNLTGEITKDGATFLTIPGQPYTGTVSWSKAGGWKLSPLGAPVAPVTP